MSATSDVHDGGCTCRAVRYRMTSAPLFVHCCHCRWCQRETGASFALNAMIEADRVELLAGEPESSTRRRTAARARRSRAARAAGSRSGATTRARATRVRFVRVGTLDEPDRLPPDIHIFTASKQPWVSCCRGAPAALALVSPFLLAMAGQLLGFDLMPSPPFQFVLATVVQFYLGARFYRSA